MSYVAKALPSVVWLSGLCVWADAAPNQAPQDSMVPLTITARVELQPRLEAIPRNLLPGDVVHTGDRFSVTSWVDQKAFLYVIGYEPDGWSSLLFPQGRHVQVAPGEKIRLPAGETSYKLNSRVGEVNLYIYASRKPLDAAACTKLRLPCPLWAEDGAGDRGEPTRKEDAQSGKSGAQTNKSGANASAKREPPPSRDGSSARDRGGAIMTDVKTRLVHVRGHDNREALMLFWFRHES